MSVTAVISYQHPSCHDHGWVRRQQLHLAALGAPNRWDFLVAMVYNPTGQLDV